MKVSKLIELLKDYPDSEVEVSTVNESADEDVEIVNGLRIEFGIDGDVCKMVLLT